MRFMNGDNPAVEMEDGTQHGRHFGCVGCDGNINRNYHLAYTFQRRHQTLLKKQDLVKSAPAGRKLGLHPFKNMKINELNNELAARGLSTEGSRQELQKELSEVLGDQHAFLCCCMGMSVCQSMT